MSIAKICRRLPCVTVNTKFNEFLRAMQMCVQKVQQGCLFLLVQHTLFCSSIPILLPLSFIDSRDKKTVHHVRLKTFRRSGCFASAARSKKDDGHAGAEDDCGLRLPSPCHTVAEKVQLFLLEDLSFGFAICPRQPFCRRSSENLTVPFRPPHSNRRSECGAVAVPPLLPCGQRNATYWRLFTSQ